jgi:hypothetical protein
MMWMPDRHNFVVDDGILTGIGKLHPWRFFKMQKQCIALCERAVQSKFSKELLVSQLIVVLENLLHHLEFISMNFCHMQLTVRETQRIFVELTALLDYYDHFCSVLLLVFESLVHRTTKRPTTEPDCNRSYMDRSCGPSWFKSGPVVSPSHL